MNRLNRQALFCDGTEYYVIPQEPLPGDLVEFRFRTGADDVGSVELCLDGEYYPLEREKSEGEFDYYHVYHQISNKRIRYYFRIRKGQEIVYYNRYGVVDEMESVYDFKICPGFSTPEWAKGAVMYQIFTDRFCNGDSSNDVVDNEYCYIGEPVKAVKDWSQNPAQMDIRNFYGGDLQGVKDKLDYLQDLGVEVIYFNPLFVSPSNHKYDIQDYDYIDPHFGVIVNDGGEPLAEGDRDNRHATKYQARVTDLENLEASNQFFAELVQEIHNRGMKVILDGVFNHCGSFNKWMDRERIYEGKPDYAPGAYVSADSPYRKWFDFQDSDDGWWPYNFHYDGWWGHDTLPKLNYDSEENDTTLEEYILHIGKKWVSEPYNIDGWRLDVAADLGHTKEYNHEFWRKFRKVVKEANPKALILAEHYGDPSEWLEGDQWDSVMNYDAFMEPITWFLTGMEKHSDEERLDLLSNGDAFYHAITHNMTCYMTPSLQTAMNELSNHDHSRFLTRTNHLAGRLGKYSPEDAETNVNKAVLREAVVMQMTWVGAPTVYYGDEAGVCGFTDPDNRRTYPWGKEDQNLIQFHREMIRIHNKYQTFRKGSLKIMLADESVLAYGRFDHKNQFVVILNNSPQLKQIKVPVWEVGIPAQGIMRRLMYSYDKSYTTEFEEYFVEDGELVVNMGAHSALVLKNKEF